MTEDAPHTGALIVLLPVVSDPINEISQEDQAHVTMLYFGDVGTLDQAVIEGIRAAVMDVSSRFGELIAKVSGRAVLGPDEAGVLLIESFELMEIRNELASDDWVQAGYRNGDQFPGFVPHVTLTYGGGLPSGDLPAEVRFGALGLWLGGQHEAFPLLPFGYSDEIEVPTETPDPINASGMIYPVDCADDLPMAVQFADVHADARWYVEKCARAFNVDCIPESWAVPA